MEQHINGLMTKKDFNKLKCGDLAYLIMKENNNVNNIVIDLLRKVEGRRIVKIQAKDDLKFWCLELDNGSQLCFDYANTVGNEIYAYHIENNPVNNQAQ